jgi:hypothetical protein
MRKAALGVLLGVVLCQPLRAELTIESASWQLAQPRPGGADVFQDVASWPTAPPKIDGKLRLRVVLKNRGPQEAEGILLRYCLAARLAPRGRAEEGIWAVPFLIGEKRVPKVGPNQHLEVTFDPSGSVDPPLAHYLQRAFDSGFWPDQLRLQVMLSPHRGAVEAIKTIESILSVVRL